MEEARRLEVQVMAGGEGFQANQAGGDRLEVGCDEEGLTK